MMHLCNLSHAKGVWQFQPETAHRLGLEVKNCALKMMQNLRFLQQIGTSCTIASTRIYRKKPQWGYSHKIDTCEVDERVQLQNQQRQPSPI